MVITGERGEESPNRAKYKEFEPHRCNAKKRHVDQWRPVLHWSERQIWDIIERYKVNPHAAYRLGWGRTSCFLCIFASNDQLASSLKLAPERVQKLADYEQQFGLNIHRKLSVTERAQLGKAFDMSPDDIKQANSKKWFQPIILAENWVLPKGAFGDMSGPN